MCENTIRRWDNKTATLGGNIKTHKETRKHQWLRMEITVHRPKLATNTLIHFIIKAVTLLTTEEKKKYNY